MSLNKNLFQYTLIGVLFVMLIVSPFVMQNNDFTITPSNPAVGSIVTITGTSQPGSSVNVQVSFEKTLPVSRGSYMFAMQKIVIPAGNNAITVKATGIQSMSVGLKQKIWTTITAKVVNNEAVLSQSNIAPGTYDAIVYGNSKLSSVVLNVTVLKQLTADSKGKYSYAYNTAGLPKGKYTVKVGSVSKSFVLN